MSVQEIYLKIKHLLKSPDIGTVGAIVLVGLSSFSLGRFSDGALEQGMEKGESSGIHEVIQALPVTAEDSRAALGSSVLVEDSEREPETIQAVESEGSYVASKSGEKYHLPWCSGAQRIKEENKVWFKTKTEAEAAGYTPAANCKGI